MGTAPRPPAADWMDTAVLIYGKDEKVQAAAFPGLWYGNFKSAPGQLVLVRDPGSRKPYDLGLFTLDASLAPAAVVERYSWRWPIEPSNAVGKQLPGVGDACNRTRKAVGRTVPFGFLVHPLLIIWYARSAGPAAASPGAAGAAPGTSRRPRPRPATCTPGSAASSSGPGYSGIIPGRGDPRKYGDTLTSEHDAA